MRQARGLTLARARVQTDAGVINRSTLSLNCEVPQRKLHDITIAKVNILLFTLALKLICNTVFSHDVLRKP